MEIPKPDELDFQLDLSEWYHLSLDLNGPVVWAVPGLIRAIGNSVWERRS